MSLGEKLKYLRLKAKTTLSKQGKILKVSMNSVYRWEHDIAVPRVSMLKKIAAYYGVPADWLMSDIAARSIGYASENKLLEVFRRLSEKNKNRLIIIAQRLYDGNYEPEAED